MKSKILLCKIFLWSFVSVSCGPEIDSANCHVSVSLINNSNKVIYFGGGNSSPQISYNPLKSGDYFRIAPKATKKDIFGRDRGCYEDLFKESQNGKLNYLFFDEQVLLNNTWEEIVAKDLVLKRYSFTVEEMQAVNWSIIYDEN